MKTALTSALPYNATQHPCVLIFGALGWYGTGAKDFCSAAGIPTSSILDWDVAETARGDSFSEIAAADVTINCIYLGAPIFPFITRESLSERGRKLRVVLRL